MKNEFAENQKGLTLGWLIIGLLALIAFVSMSARSQTNPPVSFPSTGEVQVKRVDSVGFSVSDIEKAVNFYNSVFGFEKVSETGASGEAFEHLTGVFGVNAHIVRMRLDGETIELTEYLTPQGRPIPVDSRSNDLWFQHIAIIVSDMDKAYAMLREKMRMYNIRYASTEPQRLPDWNKNAGGIKAFYFKDFDGHVLEILEFPEGKGQQKWHDLAKSGKIFLGIDHTAIVVSDSEKSVNFYQNGLGLSVAGTSDNYGTEQEHLNNVFGAKLHITGLRTKEPGIAVEFLEYVAPRGGRPYPKDSNAADLWHWQTSFTTAHAADLSNFLNKQYASDFISSGAVLFPDMKLGFRKAALMRDPDGHAIRLVEN